MKQPAINVQVNHDQPVYLHCANWDFTVDSTRSVHVVEKGVKNRFAFSSMGSQYSKIAKGDVINVTLHNPQVPPEEDVGELILCAADGSVLCTLKPDETKQLAFKVSQEYTVTFKKTHQSLRVINTMDTINYWEDTIDINTEALTVRQLVDVLLAKQNGEKVLTLGGLRQAVDSNYGIHFTQISSLAFLTDRPSKASLEFKHSREHSWFAEACWLAVHPGGRAGWSNNNGGKKYDDSHVVPLPIGDKKLSEYGVGEHGYLVTAWQSGPRQSISIDWADIGNDLVFHVVGKILS